MLLDLPATALSPASPCNEAIHLGVEKPAGILFADITGYTAFAESLTPQQTIRLLSNYYARMGQVVKDHSGRIIDYFGDGFLAVFGLDACENPALHAVEAARQMLLAMQYFNLDLRRFYPEPLGIRIGVHYGNVIAGQVGIEGMEKLAVIGDSVNFASRVEQMNKVLGTHFLITENVYNQVSHWIAVQRKFDTGIRGKKGVYTLYEVAE